MSQPRSYAYSRYYISQAGGEIPAFHGGQRGAGLGDVLRGIWRWAAPIAMRGISTFARSALDAHDKGASLKDAAKGSIMPAFGAMRDAAVNKVKEAVHGAQTGSGSSALFAGDQGVPFPNHAYKRLLNRKRASRASSAKPKRRRLANHTGDHHTNF